MLEGSRGGRVVFHLAESPTGQPVSSLSKLWRGKNPPATPSATTRIEKRGVSRAMIFCSELMNGKFFSRHLLEFFSEHLWGRF